MDKFLALARHTALGFILILLASGLLLWSDPGKERLSQNQGSQVLKVALMNFISVAVLENGEKGLLAGLAEKGFEDGGKLEIVRYNAEGDRATAILIAKDVVGRGYDLALTLSTPMLQSFASSNLDTKQKHMFTVTTDPAGAGVGVSRNDPLDHPPYMTGYGTPQPVDKLFEMARQANPRLKRVGVLWNPAESNSEASTIQARAICKKLNIELIEITVDSSAAIQESAKALLARNVEAIWAGGDTVVAAGLETMIATAASGGIPVFTNMPEDVQVGALFCLGADYFEVGRSGGHLAARILNGEDIAKIPVENFVPEQLAINNKVAPQFLSSWTIPPEWQQQAKTIVD